MHLTKEEEEALDGKYGRALALAYRVLVAIGEATEAERLVNVNWAHISGVNYNTIGDAGINFLEDLVKDESAKVMIKATLNPTGYDPNKSEEIDSEFLEKQSRINKAYEKLGVTLSYTCIPYEAFDINQFAKKGSYVSVAESNAAIYVNSVVGLLTNKESAISALASALTGKAPLSRLRIKENRNAKLCVEVKYEMKDELDYGLLGYFAGKLNEDCIAFEGIKQESIFSNEPNSVANVKALCSALGTSGSVGMFTLSYRKVKERYEFNKIEANKIKDELSNADRGDVILFGSPQLGLNDLSRLSNMLMGRKFKKRCIAFCARSVYMKAKKIGLVDKLENSNVSIYCDCCSCLTPLITKDKYDSVITNSVKAAYYLRNWNKVDVCLASMKNIVENESI